MVQQHRMFALYIHPGRGPISAIDIDLDAVVDAGQRHPLNSSAAMADAVVQQIERQFPASRAGEVRTRIETIVLRIANPLLATHLPGLAIRVPGTIEDEGGRGPRSDSEAAETIRALTAKVQTLTTQLQQERAARLKERGQLQQLQVQLRAGTAQLQGVEADMLTLRLAADESQQRLEQYRQSWQAAERESADHAAERDQALQECATLQTKLHLAEQRTSIMQQQVNAAREIKRQAEDYRKQVETLQAALDARDQFIDELQHQLHELHRADTAAATPTNRVLDSW